MLVPRKISAPKNESDLHFFLKQVALALLAQRFKCRLIATEVYLPDISKEREKLRKEYFRENKGIYADAVGLNTKHLHSKNQKDTVYSIEVKVSKQDFQNGYCVDADLNYVLTPKDLINPKDLFQGVGLLEADLESLRYYKSGEIKGVKVVKKPQRVKVPKEGNENRAKIITHALMQRSRNQLTWENLWFYPGFNQKENKKFLKQLEVR